MVLARFFADKHRPPTTAVVQMRSRYCGGSRRPRVGPEINPDSTNNDEATFGGNVPGVTRNFTWKNSSRSLTSPALSLARSTIRRICNRG